MSWVYREIFSFKRGWLFERKECNIDSLKFQRETEIFHGRSFNFFLFNLTRPWLEAAGSIFLDIFLAVSVDLFIRHSVPNIDILKSDFEMKKQIFHVALP